MQARVGIHELIYQLLEEGIPAEITAGVDKKVDKAPALFAD